MYESHFAMTEKPFSIAPDPDYLYMSTRHKEAMAHLSYGVMEAGGFALLTGEVGTGKTTLCRNLLMDLPKNVDVALILNPNINEIELLETICDELRIKYNTKLDLTSSSPGKSQKKLLDLINKYLLKAFSKNRHTVLIIDEAQLLSRDVLELVRLLTNLETTKTKLLQIILIGQPELNDMLAREDLRQLSQRVTARYHLRSLDKAEIGEYINCRLTKAGCKKPLFSRQSLAKIYQYTKGTPRLINVLCHHALLNAYSKNRKSIDSKSITQVAREVFPNQHPNLIKFDIDWFRYMPYLLAGGAILLLALLVPTLFKGKTDVPQVVQEHVSISKPLVQTQPIVIETSTVVDEVENKPPTPDQPEDVLSNEEPVAEIEIEDNAKTPKLAQTNIEVANNKKQVVEILAESKGELGRIQLIRQLAKLWNVTLQDVIFEPLCDEIKKYNLACVILNTGWQGLVDYNRPAVLELNDAEHVLLTALSEDKATIVVHEKFYEVSVDDLRQHWVGKAVLFWQPTELGEQSFALGHASSDVVWLRMTVNQALNKQDLPKLSSTISSEYDEEMAQRVSLLQQENNLKVDGIVGIQTYMLLNETLYPEKIPVLK